MNSEHILFGKVGIIWGCRIAHVYVGNGGGNTEGMAVLGLSPAYAGETYDTSGCRCG